MALELEWKSHKLVQYFYVEMKLFLEEAIKWIAFNLFLYFSQDATTLSEMTTTIRLLFEAWNRLENKTVL